MRGAPDGQDDEFEGWLPLTLAIIVSVTISALAIFSSFAGWPF